MNVGEVVRSRLSNAVTSEQIAIGAETLSKWKCNLFVAIQLEVHELGDVRSLVEGVCFGVEHFGQVTKIEDFFAVEEEQLEKGDALVADSQLVRKNLNFFRLREIFFFDWGS